MREKLTKIIKQIKLRTWIALGVVFVLGPIAIFGVYGITASPSPPTAYWKMDEGVNDTCSGGSNDVCDSSVNGYDGAITGATWRAEDMCVSGKCLQFDGNDTVNTGNNTLLNFERTDSFSVSFWFRTNSNTQMTFISKQATATDFQGWNIQSGNTTGYIYFQLVNNYSGGSGNFIEVRTSNLGFADNNWHHVEATYDGSDAASGVAVYFDGHNQTLTTIKDGPIGATTQSSNDVHIGSRGGSQQFYSGFLDDVKIYTYTRSANQVKTDHIKGASEKGSSAVFGAEDTAFLSEGLVGYWKMDETSGNASDSSGNGTTLTNVSTTVYSGAKYGNGIEPDGSADYFYAADNANISVTGSLTLAAWIQPDDTTGSQDIIAKWDGANESYLLALEGANLRMYIDSGSNYQASTGTPITANTFQHVAGVYNSATQTVKLFVNGVEVASTTTGTIPSAIGDDDGRLHLGAEDSTTSAANFFDGHIDDARVYNRALSASEIEALNNWAPGPVGYWSFNENSGSVAYDRSGQSNNGTFSGNVGWAIGKFGSATTYDGSDDEIDVGSATVIDNLPATGMTISAWIYPESLSGTFSYRDIITKAQNNNPGSGWAFAVRNTGAIQFAADFDGASNLDHRSQSSVITTNNWYHVAATWDGSNTASNVKLYVNGVDVGGGTLTNGVGNRVSDAAQTMYLGGVGAGGVAGESFHGMIDEMRVYNYTRTAGQIVEDMNAGHPLGGSPIGSQVLYWPLDDKYGTLTSDRSPNAYHATLTSNPVFKTRKDCKVNGCISYDGSTNAYARRALSSSDSISQLTSGTVAVWAKESNTDGGTIWSISRQVDTNNSRIQFFYDAIDNRIEGLAVADNTTQWAFYVETSDFNPDNESGVWHHYVMTHDGTTPAMYIDGKPVTITFTTSTDKTDWFKSVLVDATSDADGIQVGVIRTNNGSGSLYNGDIDEFQVYGSVLTEDQIKIVVNANSAVSFGATADDEGDAIAGGAAPIAYYKFDEGTYTNDCSTITLWDSIGGINGVSCPNTTGPTMGVPGKIGSTVRLDGSDDYFNLGDVFKFTSSFSVSAWVNLDDYSASVQQPIAAKIGGGSARDWQFAVQTSAASDPNTFLFRIADSTTTIVTRNSVTTAPLDTWTHVTGVYNASAQTLDIYINGRPDNGTLTGTVPASIVTSTNSVNIGRRASTGEVFDGMIDELKFFNYALTPAQVAYNYNRGAALANWQMDENTGTTVNDSSGNSFTGTLNGTASWTGGKFNYAIDFDGSTNYVQVSDNTALRFDSATQDFSLFAWVKRDANGEMNIISKEDADNDGWRLQFTSGNAVRCSVNSIDIDSTLTITDTNWHHVGCTIDRDGNGQVYIDGAFNGTPTAISSTAMATTSNIIIGTRSYTSANYLNGRIDDVRIYNYALSPVHIQRLYNGDSIGRFGPLEGAP